MKLQKLVETKRVREQQVAQKDIQVLLDKADEDLRLSGKLLSESISWAYTISYNAVLQASRGYIFSKGYRPESNEAHKNTFMFLLADLESELTDLITYFDRVRVKRHRAVYDAKTDITETEAAGLHKRALEFVALLRKRIEESYN